ncbi:type II secretion system F family protein [Parapedobacter sp. 10938]|uniref:type II secretion system F family protein n=1 Tax=Parapedobacter flavus TaxID=3110225 RepID=UPI002DBE305A|nr:type II secretion system F family protein [Parapedobacter sp. 10938]MEC3882012.1 type II secretion system F family protein [Parapedobacter sp. 10938]
MNGGIDIRKIKGSSDKSHTTRKASAMAEENKSGIVHLLTRDITLFSSFGDKQKETMYHELNILLQAGIDLKAAFDMLISLQPNKKNAAMLKEIQDVVVQGSSFSKALKQQKAFTPYEYHSIQIGEETGKIAGVLQDLAGYYRKRLKQRRQIVGALTYPVIVILTSFAAIFFMMNFVVPMFADIFQRSGGNLPPVTRLIVNVSDLSRRYAPLMVFLAMLLFGWLYIRRKNPWNRRWTAYVFLNLPIFGRMVRKVFLARFCNSMSLLTSAKIPLTRALYLCRQMVDFYPIEISLEQVENRVMHGYSLHTSLKEHSIYDIKLVSLVKVGEEVNQLAEFFGKVADQYNEEVEYQSAAISALLEPLIIIFLGLFVGLILIAMYLPMFQMGDIFG